jgi:hypothetical protein
MTWLLYDCPTVPEGSNEVVMFTAGQAWGVVDMVTERFFCAVCTPEEQLSVTPIVKLKLPAVVGVPESTPVTPRPNPGGNVPDTTL